MNVNADDLHSDFIPELLSAISSDINSADGLWNARPTDYDVEYDTHTEAVNMITEMRDRYQQLDALMAEKIAEEARLAEERRYNKWVDEMEDIFGRM